MMLQVISKKFFRSENYHRTKEKYVIYSNVNLFYDVETEIATLEKIETFNGITTYLLRFENVLEYQKDLNFQLVSVGQKQIVEDLLACFSFYFNGIFSLDRNFIENLLRDNKQNICDTISPQELLPQIFKRDINIIENKSESLNKFLNNLVGLPNKKYMRVITSIKQLYDAILTISNNINLAYTMIVASIESLATNVDEYKTEWEDCLTQNKDRERLDQVLEDVPDGIAQEIKNIIIEGTHAKLGTRYRCFILKYIDDSYYEESINEEIIRCKESQLNIAIKNSYNIRSEYIHELEEIPPFIKIARNTEVLNYDNKIFFSFIGIVRISKFVINKFIELEEKLEHEDFNYFDYLPGMMKGNLAPEYWIGNEKGYTINTIRQYYQGLLQYVSSGEYRKAGFINLGEVCSKIEKLIRGENNNDKKVYMFNFYLLYNYMILEKYRCKNLKQIEEQHGDLIDEKRIENSILYIVLGNKLPWDLYTIEKIYNEYDKKRYNKNTLKIPNKLEICLILEIANNSFAEDDKEALEKYINKAFKERPDDKFVKEIYYRFKENQQFEIVDWYKHYIMGE